MTVLRFLTTERTCSLFGSKDTGNEVQEKGEMINSGKSKG